MPRFLSWIPTVVLLAAPAAPAAAVTVIVPDDHPTIQAAIDGGADVIQVRGGLLPERLTITREVTIEAGPPPPYLWSWAPTPMVQSLEVHPEAGGDAYSPRFTVRGVRFLGEVRLDAPTRGYLFESCRFDSGFIDLSWYGQAGHYVSVRNCMILGDVRATGAVQFAGNTVIGGTVRIFSDGLHDLSHNYILGPADAGLELHLDASYGPIAWNTIRNTGDGIRFIPANSGGWHVRHNDIADCTGDGIVYQTSASGDLGVRCDSNLVANCGGAGITIRNHPDNPWTHSARIIGNTIRNTGQSGILLPGAFPYPVRGNLILDTGGDGFTSPYLAEFEGNVIGRSAGAGLRVTDGLEGPIAGNTFFLNGGAGMHFASAGNWNVITRNISAFNFGPGIQVDGGLTAPALSCNDWFANAGGATVGVSADSTDLSVYPHFCDPDAGDLHLSTDSPLLAAGNCGLIGALGPGCGGLAAVKGAPPVVAAGLRAWPAPSGGLVTVIVPDDHPTIQAAIDAGADVIQVRDGLPPERLTITRSVTIEAGPPPSQLWSWAPTPMIQSLEVQPDMVGGFLPNFTVRGIRFLGEVRFAAPPRGYLFESCRFDSGLADLMGRAAAGHYVSVRNCLLLGNVRVAGTVQFTGNTVIEGAARIHSDGSHDISHNYVIGPAEAGLELSLGDSYGPITRNTILNTGDGIRFIPSSSGGWYVAHNDVSDCSGDGVVYDQGQWSSPRTVRCDSNTIARCGGAGIVTRGSPEYGYHSAYITGNVIRETGLGGIDLPQTLVFSARGNTILDAGGDGFRARLVNVLESNVIGRSGGAGLRIEQEYGIVSGNTIFANAGPGIHATVGYSSLTARNISAFNGGPGLLYETTCPPEYCRPPDLSCNDWFANAGGAVVGAEVDSTDLAVHPRFCDLTAGDVHLAADSPLLAAGDCGLIGALGQGCGSVTAVESARPPLADGLRAWPVPSRGAVAFSLPASATPAEIEVFDVTGARRWQATLPAGSAIAHWDRRETGGAIAPPGVYFARLTRAGAEVARVRVVLTE